MHYNLGQPYVDRQMVVHLIKSRKILLLFLNPVKQHSEKADREKRYHIPDYQTGDECLECQNIPAHVNAHMQAVTHKSGTNPGHHAHARKANHIDNADPRASYF